MHEQREKETIKMPSRHQCSVGKRDTLSNHQLKPDLVDEAAAGRNKSCMVAPRRRPRIMLDDGSRTAIAAAAPERAEK